MLRIASLVLSLSLIACTTLDKHGARTRKCGLTPVTVKEVEAFGFIAPVNKLAVVRIFASWCPYCKEDLTEIGKRFQSGAWKEQDVQILLLMYKNRREDKATYDHFLRQMFTPFGIPMAAAQIVFIDKDYKELVASQSAEGKPLFPDWKGVPYALVFGKDGRLAFRGHFTSSPSGQNAHYKLIDEISNETCPP